MTSIDDTVDRWVADGRRVALATVVDTKRSAPQPPGTKMALSDTGAVTGAVSGGCVEGAVAGVAEQVLAGTAPSQLLEYGIADSEAWDVGLPCGGEISIWVEPYDPGGPQARFAAAARAGERVALVTLLRGDAGAPGAKLLVSADAGTDGTLGHAALDADAAAVATEALWTERSGLHERDDALLFVDVIAPPPSLVIVGAVDFAAQLCAVARITGWRPFVIDPRSRFATTERFPAAEQVIVAWPKEALAKLDAIDRTTAICVLTHDPKLDDAALAAALESDAGYIGAMGSRRAQAKRRERLVAAGVDPGLLDARVAAPIGLDLGGLTAAETALSIMAEIVAVRHGRSGGRLVDLSGARIHEAAA